MTDKLAGRLFLNGNSPVGLYPKPPRTYEAGGHGVFGGDEVCSARGSVRIPSRCPQAGWAQSDTGILNICLSSWMLDPYRNQLALV